MPMIYTIQKHILVNFTQNYQALISDQQKVVREQRTTNQRRTQYSLNEERAIVKVGELLILSNDAPGAVPCDVVRDGAVYNTGQNGIVSRQHGHIDSRGYIRRRLYTGKILYINLLSSFC